MQEIQVYVNDVTLREGDQAPLTSFNKDEKRVISLMLAELGVDCIEVGFGMSRADFDNIRGVIADFKDGDKITTVSSLGRSVESDTLASLKALKGAKNTRVHTFIATSNDHINAKFSKFGDTLLERKQWVLNQIKTEVSRASDELGDKGEVEFSPEDATNSDFDFLIEAIETAIKSGATILNIPDTLGSFLPHESEDFFRNIVDATSNLNDKYDFNFSCHIHNDLAVSTANAISSIRGGARWIEVTQNGIGERTGNTIFHEIIGILIQKGEGIIPGKKIILPNINTKLVGPVSYFLDRILNFNKSLQKPFIGELSDKDGSGVHNASAEVYGGTKNKKHFGGRDIEEFFSPRGGANQVVSMLKGFEVEEEKGSKVIQAITEKAAIEAEFVKAVYAARLYAYYLEERGLFRIISLKVNEKNVRVCIELSGKEFCVSGEAQGENGVVSGLVVGINEFLGRNLVQVEKIRIENKPCLGDAITKFLDDTKKAGAQVSKNFKDVLGQMQETFSVNGGTSQLAIAKIRLCIGDKEVNLATSGNNIQKEIVKAIIYGSLEELYKKMK